MIQVKGQSRWTTPISSGPVEDDVLSCTKCGCTWLERILVHQYPKFHQLLLGQQPHPKNDIGFWIFKCPKCNELFEPAMTAGTQTHARKLYDALIENMIKPEDPSGEKL